MLAPRSRAPGRYVELHCHSAFSLHEGTSLPEELIMQARELGYSALALTDHDSLAGAMQFAQAGKSLGLYRRSSAPRSRSRWTGQPSAD